MPITRRSILHTTPLAAVALAGLLDPRHSLAHQATPEATPVSGQLDPQALLEALMTPPVSTTLFPSDTPAITVTEWIDESDSDLDGAIGGVLLQASEDANGNFIGPGVYIVHPGPDAARAAFGAQLADSREDETLSILGYAGAISRDPGDSGPTDAGITAHASSLIAIVVGSVIVSAIGEGGEREANDVRALANLAGMLDHLRMVQAPNEAAPVAER